MDHYPLLFSPLQVGPLTLQNRITMAPLFLNYPLASGEPSEVLLDHYREMGASGAALIVVENVILDTRGQASPTTLRIDEDRFIPGLAKLARIIKEGGALAALQLNHAGRYAKQETLLAPSAVPIGDKVPHPLDQAEIAEVVERFASAARRVKEAGFDLVELHGGTGYLLAQFLSPRTNLRQDAYGGPLENRLRFPLEVIAATKEAVGPDFPIGYRFLADEWLPDGWQLEEAVQAAPRLTQAGLAYLSVMGGTYDSFFLPERMEQEKHQGYMVDLAAAVKAAVDIPVITAGRIQDPARAEEIVAQGRADLIGLARVLLADPLWPIKAREGRASEIIPCEPHCQLCWTRVGKGRPVACSQWPKEKREKVLEGLGQAPENS